jgi:hypothetical protein
LSCELETEADYSLSKKNSTSISFENDFIIDNVVDFSICSSNSNNKFNKNKNSATKKQRKQNLNQQLLNYDEFLDLETIKENNNIEKEIIPNNNTNIACCYKCCIQ